MKAKRRFNIWLWVLLCVPCLLASCDHDVHDGEEEGGLSVSLTWADEADQGTEVKDVKLWIIPQPARIYRLGEFHEML